MANIKLLRQMKKDHDAFRKERRLGDFQEWIRGALREGDLKATDFSFCEMWEETVEGGRDICDDVIKGRNLVGLSEAVETTAFANISGQFIYTMVLEGYENSAFIGDQLVTTIPTRNSGERIPGVTPIGDDSTIVKEGEKYPETGVSEIWIDTPPFDKRGHIVSLTKEAIFFDRTPQRVIAAASNVGIAIALSKEKRIMNVVTGITNNYVRNGVAINTYGDNSGTHDWDNLSASTALQDWTDVDAMVQLLEAITDPSTGEPIANMPNAILIPPALRTKLARILNAIHVEATTNTSNVTRSPSPINSYQPLDNQYVKGATSSDSTWFMGDFKKAFGYNENWPLNVQQANPNATADFEQDIIVRYKASERGVPFVMDPRRVAKATG